MSKRRIVSKARQSLPVDTSAPYDPSTLSGKVILITGGASGFGEGFTRHWAAQGATVFVGDVNKSRGQALATEINKAAGPELVHYLHCDVTSWQSCVDFFRTAVKASPHGGIDGVVANAGIIDKPPHFNDPRDLDAEEPPEPNLQCFNVNLKGVLYTAHLAMFWLKKNPGSGRAEDAAKGKSSADRDRSLLLVGSMASLAPMPVLSLYGTAKHGVLGLFR